MVRSSHEDTQSHDELAARVAREREHGHQILSQDERNWGWHSPAGIIRRQRRADFLTRQSGIAGKVLEIGCGTGTFTGDLSRAYDDLTAIDVSDPLLEAARRKFPGVEFVNQDVHATTFEDNSFALVLGCSVLHHLDWARALREIHRILEPGGTLLFSEPNLLNPQIFLQKNWKWLKRRMGDSLDEYAFTSGQIAGDLAAAGFEQIEAEPFEFLHPAVPARLVDVIERLESALERTPARHIAGSLKISAQKSLDP